MYTLRDGFRVGVVDQRNELRQNDSGKENLKCQKPVLTPEGKELK